MCLMRICFDTVLYPFEGFQGGIPPVQQPEPVQLGFELSPYAGRPGVRSNVLQGHMLLSGAGLEAKRRCWVYGSHTWCLVRDLRSLHRRGVGQAKLIEWDGVNLVRFTASRRRGERVLVSGDWDLIAYTNLQLTKQEAYDDRHPDRQHPRAGIFVVFQGLVIQRDQLPTVIADFERLLEETGVSLEGP